MKRKQMMMAAMLSVAALGGVTLPAHPQSGYPKKARPKQGQDFRIGAWGGDGVPSKVRTKKERNCERMIGRSRQAAASGDPLWLASRHREPRGRKG